jgi:hypothetical protein
MSARSWLCRFASNIFRPTPKLADCPQIWHRDALASFYVAPMLGHITADIYAARLMRVQ